MPILGNFQGWTCMHRAVWSKLVGLCKHDRRRNKTFSSPFFVTACSFTFPWAMLFAFGVALHLPILNLFAQWKVLPMGMHRVNLCFKTNITPTLESYLLKKLLEHIAHGWLLSVGHHCIDATVVVAVVGLLRIHRGGRDGQDRPRICRLRQILTGCSQNVNIEIDLDVVLSIIATCSSHWVVIGSSGRSHNIVIDTNQFCSKSLNFKGNISEKNMLPSDLGRLLLWWITFRTVSMVLSFFPAMKKPFNASKTR